MKKLLPLILLVLVLGACSSPFEGDSSTPTAALPAAEATVTPGTTIRPAATVRPNTNPEFQDTVTHFYVINPIATWYWESSPNERIGRPVGPMSESLWAGHQAQCFEYGIVIVDKTNGQIYFYPNGKGKKI